MLSELWSELRYRLRAFLRREDVERELDDELRFHIEREAEKYVRAGLHPDEARRRARVIFGGVELTKERSRDARGIARLESLAQDVRYALRSLRQHRAFSVTVVLTLALGIGANVAIFALVDALLLRPLPVPHPERLVTIGDPAAVNSRWSGSPETEFVSYPLYLDLRSGGGVLSGVYANGAASDPDVIVGHDAAAVPEHPDVRLVSGNYFRVLEIAPFLGRVLTEDDDRPGEANPVAVISYRYWERRFGKESTAIGSVIRMNGVPVTIIGVSPPPFAGDIVGQPIDMWLPIAMQPRLTPRANYLTDREVSWLVLMGRLAPGVTIEQARAVLPNLEARAVRAHLAGIHLQRFEEDLKSSPVRVESGVRGFSRHREVYGRALVVLLVAVTLVVLVVCANVSNLVLARAVARMREVTLRMTLGAGRGRLVQQLLTESILLAAIAGAIGLLVAVWGSRVLLGVVQDDPPVVLDVTPNGTLLAFTAGAALACVVLFGLMPAFRVTRVDLATALRGHGRSVGAPAWRRGKVSLSKLLVIAQVALSTVLLTGSGLLVRSMTRLLQTDLGMDREHLVVAHVAASRSNYLGRRLLSFEREALARVHRVRGVEAASYSLGGPFSGGHSAGHVVVSGFVAQADSEGEAQYDYIGPDYFRAMGTRVLRGRDFSAADVDGHANVAAVNATMAKYYFRGRDPIGETLTLDGDQYTVVSVVGDVEYSDIRAKPVRRFYIADADPVDHPRSFELEMRVRGEPRAFVEPIRRALAELDPTVPVQVSPVSDRVRQSLAQDALLTQVTAVFGIITLLLSALGLYGVTAYATTQRTSEFGLRAALGADSWRVAAMVLRDAIGVALCGIVVGLPVGSGAARLLQGTLFGVSPFDLPSLAGAVIVLVVTAVVASYLPAWRASKVSPLEALRNGS